MTDNENLLLQLRGMFAKSSEDNEANIAALRKDLVAKIDASDVRYAARFNRFEKEYKDKFDEVKRVADAARDRVAELADLTEAQGSEHDMSAQAAQAAAITAKRVTQAQIDTLVQEAADAKTKLVKLETVINKVDTTTETGFEASEKRGKKRTLAGYLTATSAVLITILEIVRLVAPPASAAPRQYSQIQPVTQPIPMLPQGKP